MNLIGHKSIPELDRVAPDKRDAVYDFARRKSHQHWQIWIGRILHIVIFVGIGGFMVVFGIDEFLSFWFIALAFSIIIVKIMDNTIGRKYIRRYVREYLREVCDQCGYDLTGTTTVGIRECPECGSYNDPDRLIHLPDESESLIATAEYCARCGCHLRDTIDAGNNRCPQCGRKFDLKEAKRILAEN